MQRAQCPRCSRHFLNVRCCNCFHSHISKVRVVLYIQCHGRKLILRDTGTCIHRCAWGWGGIGHQDVSYQILHRNSRPSMWGAVHFSVSSHLFVPSILDASEVLLILHDMSFLSWSLQLMGHLSPLPAARHGNLCTCSSVVWSQGRGGTSEWAPGWVKASLHRGSGYEQGQ